MFKIEINLLFLQYPKDNPPFQATRSRSQDSRPTPNVERNIHKIVGYKVGFYAFLQIFHLFEKQ